MAGIDDLLKDDIGNLKTTIGGHFVKDLKLNDKGNIEGLVANKYSGEFQKAIWFKTKIHNYFDSNISEWFDLDFD